MSLNASKEISSGQLIVLEIELSIHFCAAACIRTWSNGGKVCALTKYSGNGASSFRSRHSFTA
ncbi:hypothetical protein GALL_518090 [mine drainage metagenome]|uniref:Uncharacterized protein n=1 Tax=mine drainage metagenome TaxID=410659 RepID=A0A1J5PGE0_9ZZZZ